MNRRFRTRRDTATVTSRLVLGVLRGFGRVVCYGARSRW
jgi:hypothetical protein